MDFLKKSPQKVASATKGLMIYMKINKIVLGANT